jgi:hypothetical protein
METESNYSIVSDEIRPDDSEERIKQKQELRAQDDKLKQDKIDKDIAKDRARNRDRDRSIVDKWVEERVDFTASDKGKGKYSSALDLQYIKEERERFLALISKTSEVNQNSEAPVDNATPEVPSGSIGVNQSENTTSNINNEE